MAMDPFRPSARSSFRSRRSHPSLNHISLAPLTPRFPIHGLPQQGDYFADSHGDSGSSYPNLQQFARTSYLSSSSVPSTPPILSHSRSDSHTRHLKRSKSSSRVLSDTNLPNLGAAQPLHHHGGGKKSARSPGTTLLPETTARGDSEWLLRAGLALASSTREEKGQSWLVKRESSTSLVSDADYDDGRPPQHGRSSRRPRSGLSTPAALSRRGSRSRGASRGASRADLSMTALDAPDSNQRYHSRKSSAASEHRNLVPDFVDEKIRAEMASIQRDGDFEDEESLSSYGSTSDSEDDIDETELQRLTRERGFGLGGWIDRFVGWTLFGVEEEWPAPPVDRSTQGVTFSDSQEALEVNETDENDDHDDSPLRDDELPRPVEKAGEKGGWADVSWFLRLARNSMM
ncbi:hypothetical protein VTN77DRAFT_1191 [Rasamsonia byssochlamydoides]|uniref:uncharacterized protein n=1 Tax=Rasamsonia byssochlamydoides TaxID=89139 RepID=UPI0037432FFC